MKALTFSYDDGVRQDRHLVDIFNKYGLKATFNINSGILGQENSLEVNGILTNHNKVFREEVSSLYKNHEVAVHTLTHPILTHINDSEVIRQIEDDRKNIEELVGYEVCGMAYPCGGVDQRVVTLMEKNTKIKYARTTSSTYNYDLQENLLMFNPTISHFEFDKMIELGKRFLSIKPDKPQLYYIWGHSYEFDSFKTWDRFEEFCKMMSGQNDIFYGTNRDVILSSACAKGDLQ